MLLENTTTDLEPLDDAGFGLSYGQRALWFLDRLAPGNAAYIIAGAARILGSLDTPALRRAAVALAARHPALRTTFHDTPEGPVQRVGAEPRVEIIAADVANAANAAALAGPELARRLVEIAFRPFDLARGPLLRLGLVTSAEGQVLTVSVHHIVGDFWSLGVLLRDLGALYARELGAASTWSSASPISTALPPPPAMGPGEVVRREEESLAGARGEELLTFWRQALAGTPFVLDLSTDRPRPPAQGFQGAAQRVRLAPGPTDALKRLARRQGATLYMGLLAGFEILLSRYTGQEKLLVGCPTTRRHDADLAGLVGYLVNPVPIPGDLGGSPSGAELLGRVRRAALASFAHQDYPLPLLAERLQPERDPGRSPLFQAVLILQKGRKAHEAGLAALAVGEAGVPFDLGPLALESVALAEPGVQFDLQVGLAETARGLAGRWLYDRDLFEPATMERMAGHFTNLLLSLAEIAGGGEAGLARPVSELPLLAAGERAQILVEWAGTASAYPREGTIHALFAEQAAQTPEAVALVAGGLCLSYGELAARAVRLAGVLAALGVGPEVPVALALPRSPGLIVATLAVLAAGGAYLPLDPAYPPERLALMLAEGRVPVLLATPELERGLPASARVVLLATDGRLPPG
ncbi:MAG TPA: condensation domain-containing protein, partial [Thermoanaerobaculia bacterium]|nr:condensation domain-containing protein [Thermoanaerobaculia bacterium]